MGSFLRFPILATPVGLPATRDEAASVIPFVDWTNNYTPDARFISYDSMYDNSYYGDYNSRYSRYWAERNRRDSYRFFWPPMVHHSYSVSALPYGYYPYYYPPYYGGGPYGQYPQYAQPQQQEQPQQLTKEQIEQATRAEVTRQMDNISQAFIAGNYGRAVVRAQEAVKQMPDNTTLRFIYAQTLFADGRYPNASIALRSTLEKMIQTGQQNVYYAASLYPDQETLNRQIYKLIEALKLTPSSSNLRLLLGYQLLGVGRTDEGLSYLRKAAQDSVNERAALYLVTVSSKVYHDIEQKTPSAQVEQKATAGQVEKPVLRQKAGSANEPNTQVKKATP